jgi:hypothetical protein
VTLKTLVTGVAVATVIGGATAGVTSIASGAPGPAPQVQPAVFGIPLPQAPEDDLPTSDQLAGILTEIAAPGVSFRSKGYLVEGGVGILEGRTADRLLANANSRGSLPLNFQVTNVMPAGPLAATATVTAAGPNLAPVSQNITFVNQGGWKLSKASAMALLQSAMASA